MIALAISLSIKYITKKGVLLSNSSANLQFTLDNCTLLISDHADPYIENPIYTVYRVPQELKVDQDQARISMDMNSDPQTFSVSNGLGDRYCWVELFVKKGTQLQSLEINCPSCNIVQNTSFPFEVAGDVTIKGESIHANFRDLSVGKLDFETKKGYIQLSNIISGSASNKINITSEGDIIIQSTQDLRVQATTEYQAFCFAAPALNLIENTDCAISGDTSTDGNKVYYDCDITYDICTDSSCTTPTAQYLAITPIGNIYANLIPAVDIPVTSQDPYTRAYGQIYDDGIKFSPEADDALSGFNDLIKDQSKGNPSILLDIGDVKSQSALYSKWVLSSAPTYGLMRPWWIGTLSLTLLNGYQQKVSGSLLPGFCSYTSQYLASEMLEIQNLIHTKIKNQDTLVTFVNDHDFPEPPDDPQIDTGVFTYSEARNPFDKWFNAATFVNGDFVFNDNNYTSKWQILGAIILSLIIAMFVAYFALEVTVIGINVMYYKLVNFARHMDSYSKLEQTKVQRSLEKSDKKTKKVVKVPRYNLLNIMKHSPSPSAFIDYLSLILYRQFSNSVAQYYQLLFKKVTIYEIDEGELNPARDMIRGPEAKILYEKFCFMNHLNEEKLTDEVNVATLKTYGFKIQTRDDLLTEVLMKINIKNYDDYLTNPVQHEEGKDSLDIYISENVEITEFDEDQVEVKTFLTIYNSYCDHNRLPRVIVSPSLMKERFNIDTTSVAQQFIVRSSNDLLDHPPATEWWQIGKKLSIWWDKRKLLAPTRYIIDPSKLNNHFKLVMNKYHELDEEQLLEATKDLVLYPYWWAWDGFTVAFHILIGALITVPLVALVILNESQYEPWSLKDPRHLIMFTDVIRDPENLIKNLYSSFGWNLTIMIIVSILWIMSFIDLMLYYGVMEFPQDRSFNRSEDEGESFWQKLSRRFEWILTLLALAFYYGYIGLVLTWLLLGAFINPNSFLPFASAAVTFVVFVVTKYKAFKSLSENGSKAVMNYLKTLFTGFINKVMGKLSDRLEKASDSIKEKGLSMIKNEGFRNAASKLIEANIVDEKAVAEYKDAVEALDNETNNAGTVAAEKDPAVTAKEIEKLTYGIVNYYNILLTNLLIERQSSAESERGVQV